MDTFPVRTTFDVLLPKVLLKIALAFVLDTSKSIFSPSFRDRMGARAYFATHEYTISILNWDLRKWCVYGETDTVFY